MNDTLFENIVGQDKPKKELSFYLDSYLQTRMVPNMMIVAPKGQGKTTMARALAKGLVQFDENGAVVMVPSKIDPNEFKPKRKTFVELNAASMRSVKAFIQGFIVPYVQDKDVTVFVDEAGEIHKDVATALLTILNPNPENRTSYSLDEYVCDFDFRRQTFIFATNEVQKVNPALVDRLERITLEEYTLSHLAQIVQKGLPAVECKDDVLLDVATVLRGNARAAQKMAEKIKSYLKGLLTFTKGDWTKLKDVLSIYPLGLNDIELQVLRILASRGNMGTALTGLSAKTGMSRGSLQKDTEMYLQKHSLIEITTTGRIITAHGLLYLKALDQPHICPT